MMDTYLTFSELDSAFIATNFDENELENNDARALCRYEFLEILVRLAKIKFYDCKKVSTMSEALSRILHEHVFAYPCEAMPWKEFREQELWNILVDQIFKANKKGLDDMYWKLAGKEKIFGK